MFSWLKKEKSPEPRFDFPFQRIERTNDQNKICTEMWKSADKSRCFPVFVLYNELLDEVLRENSYEEDADLEEYLRMREDEELEFLEEISEYTDSIIGSPEDTAEGAEEFASFDLHEDADILLVSTPSEEPWQIFRKIPFGAYNECPPPNVLAAFSKMAYEKFGAVPAVISGDTLEFAVSRRPSKEEAFELAHRMNLLCPDLTAQGFDSVYALADSLTKSDVWFFWWD